MEVRKGLAFAGVGVRGESLDGVIPLINPARPKHERRSFHENGHHWR